MACCGGDSVKDDKHSDFSDACYTGNVEKMKEQMKKQKGGDVVNGKDAEGLSPLHRASQNGNTETIRFLVDNEADCRSKSKSGETPLHIACFHRNKHAVQELLKTTAKADVNSKDQQHEMTPLHVAVYRGAPDIADMLIASGADPNIKDKYDQDCFQMAKFWEEQEKQGLASPNAKHKQTLQLIEKKGIK